jgi:hypothetical protein
MASSICSRFAYLGTCLSTFLLSPLTACKMSSIAGVEYVTSQLLHRHSILQIVAFNVQSNTSISFMEVVTSLQV